MERVFASILNTSLVGGGIVLVILLLRLLLGRVSKKTACMLWGILALRLLIPIGWNLPQPTRIEPDSTPTETVEITTTATEITATPSVSVPTLPVTPSEPIPTTPAPAVSEAPSPRTERFYTVGTVVWMVGTVGMLLYCAIRYSLLRKAVRNATHIEENIYELNAPSFLFGILRPKIYLPKGLTDAERNAILLHERMHQKRGDHIWKWLGMLLLSVYWFHPLMWLAFALFGRDVEFACDAAVTERMTWEEKAAYATVLLEQSISRPKKSTPTLLFAEAGVKERIFAIMKQKKTSRTLLVLTGCTVVLLAIGVMLSPIPNVFKAPVSDKTEETPEEEVSEEISLPAYAQPHEIDVEAVKAWAEEHDVTVRIPLGYNPGTLYMNYSDGYLSLELADALMLSEENARIPVYFGWEGLVESPWAYPQYLQGTYLDDVARMRVALDRVFSDRMKPIDIEECVKQIVETEQGGETPYDFWCVRPLSRLAHYGYSMSNEEYGLYEKHMENLLSKDRMMAGKEISALLASTYLPELEMSVYDLVMSREHELTGTFGSGYKIALTLEEIKALRSIPWPCGVGLRKE